MAGIADLLYLGQPDPARQLAAMLSGQQQQPQGQQPPQQNPNAPAPNAQPVSADPNAPNPAPGQPAPPNSQPQPTALQSTPDMSASYQQLANPPNLMSLYMQMDARNRAEEHINHGLALIAAHFSSPAMANTIMQSVGGGPDAGQQVGNLMSLYQTQQGMAAQQQLLAHADEYDQKLGLPSGTSKAEILAGRGPDLVSKIASETAPTEMAKNYGWARKTYSDAHPGASPDEIDQGAQGILLGMSGGGGDSATRAWVQAKRLIPPAEWPDHPELKDPLTFGLYTEDQKKRQANVDTAAGGFGQYNTGLMDVRGKIAAIQSNPELKNVLQNPLLLSAVKTAKEGGLMSTLSADAQGAFASATPEQKQLVNDILDLSDPDYIKALQGKAGGLQGDVMPITSALSALGRLGTAPKQYGGMLTGALDAVDNARANAYGASGQLDAIDNDELRKRVSSAYLPGGASFVGQGKPMPSDEIAAAKKSMQDTPKATVIDLYRRHGYNTKPIE